MLYIYRQKGSNGAQDLAEGIMLYRGEGGERGIPARRTKGKMLRELKPGDAVICWGDHFAAAGNVKTLNNLPPISKYDEALKLKAAGVSTIEVSRTKPAPVRAEKPAFAPGKKRINAAELVEFQAANLVAELQRFINEERQRRIAYDQQPAPVVENATWLPRRNNHVGGNDLLAPVGAFEPHYYSKKLDIVEEYRLHMFRGKSIRAGKKTQQPARPNGTAPHAWIRSYDAGWVIKYDGFKSTKEMRELAAAALKALGLDFGAVDMGKTRDGKLVVLEVNRAPGVEGGTVDAYAKHIIAWVNGQEAAE